MSVKKKYTFFNDLKKKIFIIIFHMAGNLKNKTFIVNKVVEILILLNTILCTFNGNWLYLLLFYLLFSFL